MGLLDWLGPTSLTKRHDTEPPPAVVPERKAQPPGMVEGFNAAFTVQTLVHGPGASDILYGPSSTSQNSAVAACLQAIAAAIAEPELKVYRVAPGERIEQADTALGALLARPNPHFSMDVLLSYVATCEHVDGNAYWRKLRSGTDGTGNVVELWPISPSRISPVTESGSGAFIDYYRYYYTSTQYIDLLPSDVVHFRFGLDDRDHRLGCAPLKRLLREISADGQATRYADRLLSKLAINGLTLTFDKDAPPLNQAQADELKARLNAAYGGDNVGSTAVLSPGATLHALGFSPEQMDMKTLHRVPEERISAVLGVPAIVAGLGAGLDRSTFANVKEAREMFTESKLIPLWRALAAELTLQLVPDFVSDSSTLVEFDISTVRALADDQNAKASRLDVLVRSAQITLNEARGQQGLKDIEGGDVLLVPGAWAPTPPSHLAALAAAPADASGPAGATGTGAPTPPAVRARPRIVTLMRDPRRDPPEQKAAEDLPNRYDDLRASELPDWEHEMIAFLIRQERRIQRRLDAGADTADELVTEGEAILLGETLTPLQLRVLGEVRRLVVAELGIEFQLDDPATRAFLRDAGVNIVGITDATRSAVQGALLEGQMAGEGIPELAARLRDLPAFNAARGRVVARTELGTSQNHAALTSYRGSGVVVGVRVLDGDYDGACEAMNGRTFALDNAPAALQHPQCVRSFAPITDAAELTRSA